MSARRSQLDARLRTLREAVERLTGEIVKALESTGGGDIGESFCATLASGERLFAKHYSGAPAETVAREAEGLRWLAEPGVVPVARVRGFDEAARLLLLEWIEPGRANDACDAAFGRALAALHKSGAPTFGLQPDNFIGRLPQSNRNRETWAEFYAAERITPQLRPAHDAGHLATSDIAKAGRLIARLPALFSSCDEPPSRLHGDLWGGNRLCDAAGRSWLIDPAAYAGHREMDLAMMRLFGGFSEEVFAAYAEAWPLAPGAHERVPLCQLYPLLVHVNLFGAGYTASVREILDRFA